MVSKADIDTANQLIREHRHLGLALGYFDDGGRIVGMTVAGPAQRFGRGNLAPTIAISTYDIDYPPQMVEAIKTALQARQGAIIDELSALGVTGIEAETHKAVVAARR